MIGAYDAVAGVYEPVAGVYEPVEGGGAMQVVPLCTCPAGHAQVGYKDPLRPLAQTQPPPPLPIEPSQPYDAVYVAVYVPVYVLVYETSLPPEAGTTSRPLGDVSANRASADTEILRSEVLPKRRYAAAKSAITASTWRR